MMDEQKEIVMTPWSKPDNTTVIKIEKVLKNSLDERLVAHKAGGDHKGLIINKQQEGGEASREFEEPFHLQLEFKCFLVDQKTSKHIPELRLLKFWFSEASEYLDKVTNAYCFFSMLIREGDFPRDYVGFIKKIMKQMQMDKFKILHKLIVEMKQLNQQEAVKLSSEEDKRPEQERLQEKLIQILEAAFPNMVLEETLTGMMKIEESSLKMALKELSSKKLIKELEPGRWVRRVLENKSELRVIKTIGSNLVDGGKPSVAIITSKYCEKLAVDSMMTNKTSFVRFKSEGDSNVYTIGNIGLHKVVSTKLPLLGNQRKAQISSGNTTTRLLGTFGDVEHVILVGTCGGVPHFADFFKHVRLGDILVSSPTSFFSSHHCKTDDYSFIHCDKIIKNKGFCDEKIKQNISNSSSLENILASTSLGSNIHQKIGTGSNESSRNNTINRNEAISNLTSSNNSSSNNLSDGSVSMDIGEGVSFSVKGWKIKDPCLLELAKFIVHQNNNENSLGGWKKHIKEGLEKLTEEGKFDRPPLQTDRLFMSLGGNDLIEVGHPPHPNASENQSENFSTVRFGTIGSGQCLMREDNMRMDFANKYNCIGLDSDFDQVLDSVEGSRKESYLIIRGVSDYNDGTKVDGMRSSCGGQWQNYSALTAAAFLKELLLSLPQSTNC